MNTKTSDALNLILRGFTELFNALRDELRGEFHTEVSKLKARLPRWVTDEQAQEITGLSRGTLRRHRMATDSLIIWKSDHGIRYDYDSLLRHNEARAIGRGRLGGLLSGQA